MSYIYFINRCHFTAIEKCRISELRLFSDWSAWSSCPQGHRLLLTAAHRSSLLHRLLAFLLPRLCCKVRDAFPTPQTFFLFRMHKRVKLTDSNRMYVPEIYLFSGLWRNAFLAFDVQRCKNEFPAGVSTSWQYRMLIWKTAQDDFVAAGTVNASHYTTELWNRVTLS